MAGRPVAMAMANFSSEESYGRQPRMSAQLRAISIEYSHDDLAAATGNFSKDSQLGSGNYGSVYRGELQDGSLVAIKAIDLGAIQAAGQSGEAAGFEDEVQTLSKWRHPNLVTLQGWGKHQNMRYLIYELLEGGDAFQRLSKSKQGKLAFSWWERLSVLLNACQGLSHMHNNKPKGFHRDIKSANILLDRHGTAKMADFGLSCAGYTNSVRVKTISGTPGYACPIYTRTGCVTEGSEVYSFGMCMLEFLCTMAPAIADPRKPGAVRYPIAENIQPNRPDAVQRAVNQADRDAGWPAPLATEIATLGVRCVNDRDENARPKFVEVVRALRKMTENYPAPEKFTVTGSLPPSFASQVPQPPAQVVVANAATKLASVAAQPKAVAGYPGAGGAHLAQQMPQKQTPLAQMQLVLVLMSAAGVDVDGLPRKLTLTPTTPSSESSPGTKLVAYIGRQHQPELFEAWLPDLSLRNCISRTAFEVTLGPARSSEADALWVVVRGANPMTVDGRSTPRGAATPVQLGSEVGFCSDSDVRSTFLALRLQPAHLALPAAGPAVGVPAAAAAAAVAAASTPSAVQGQAASAVPVPVSKAVSVPISKAAVPQTAQSRVSGSAPSSRVSGSAETLHTPVVGASPSHIVAAAATPPSNAATAVAEPPAPAAALPGTTRTRAHTSDASTPASSTATPASALTAGGWRLECVKAEGLTSESLDTMPPELRSFPIQDAGTVLLGRQHQPQCFEALLAGAPSRLSFISRTHVQLEVRQGTLYATNMSSNPIYVGRNGLDRGSSCALAKDDILSFARNEGNSHVNFLALRVLVPEAASAPSGAAAAAASSAATSAAATPSAAVAATGTSPPAQSVKRPSAGASAMPARQNESLDPGPSPPSTAGEAFGASKSLPSQNAQSGGPSFSVHEGKAIRGGVSDLFVGTMTPEEAKLKAASLPDCHGFCYEGSPTGGPFTIFFKSRWEAGNAPGWTAYRYHRKESADPEPGPSLEPGPPPQPPQRKPAMPLPKEAPESPKKTRPGPPPPTATDSPPKRKPAAASTRSSPSKDVPPFGFSRSEEVSRATAVPPNLGGQPSGPSEPTADTKVVLELSGDGVLEVPLAQRRIGPQSLAIEPIVVGRRHQPELHRRAVAKDCLQFLSRDHFQISFANGRYQLRALTSNPIWRARANEDSLELTAQQNVDLVFGDRIALGTGDSVTSSATALRTLCWSFRRASDEEVAEDSMNQSDAGTAAPFSDRLKGFAAALEEALPARPSPRNSPRSPGGRGPRVSSMGVFGGNGNDNSWEPMLPNPAAVFGGGFGAERPSEVCMPDPRQLPSDHRNQGGSSATYEGGSSRTSGVMRPPVPFPEEGGSPRFAQGGIDITRMEGEATDEFARSGFDFR